MPMWSKLYFQNSSSPLSEHMIMFHDHSMIIILITLATTSYLMFLTFMNNKMDRHMSEAQEMELFWTSVPSLMLICIAIPSLKTLYLSEEILTPIVSIKTMGLQWFWTYEASFTPLNKTNSLLISTNLFKNLSTSSHLVIPTNTPTRLMVTSKDVIHSWAIPSSGIKLDATPGRINQTSMMIKHPMFLTGQCSEICGAGHSFMPIFVEAPSIKKFVNSKFN